MAFRVPPATGVVTTTTGTGAYAIGAALSRHFTFAQAVTHGWLADGDTVPYFCKDAATPPNEEEGIGTYSAAGATLARTTILRSTNGGAAVSWAAGSKDLVVGAPSPEIVLMQRENVFTVNQSIRRANPLFNIDALSGDAQVRLYLGGVVRAALGVSASAPVAYWDYFDATGTLKGRALLGDDRIEFANTGAASGRGLVHFPNGGAVGMIFTTAVPTYWTRVDETEDRVLRFAQAAETPGTAGGSWTISGLSVQGTALTEANLPPHTHGLGSDPVFTNNSTSPSGALVTVSTEVVRQITITATQSTGGGTTHTHGLSADGTWRPRFEIAAKATFN